MCVKAGETATLILCPPIGISVCCVVHVIDADVVRSTDYQLKSNVTIGMLVAMCGSDCNRWEWWLANIAMVIASVSGSAAAAATLAASIFALAAAAGV